MTDPIPLERRKAIARKAGQGWKHSMFKDCERYYPRCCQYHEGYDDALGGLEEIGWIGVEPEVPGGEWYFHYEDETPVEPTFDDKGIHTDGYRNIRPVFVIEEVP